MLQELRKERDCESSTSAIYLEEDANRLELATRTLDLASNSVSLEEREKDLIGNCSVRIRRTETTDKRTKKHLTTGPGGQRRDQASRSLGGIDKTRAKRRRWPYTQGLGGRFAGRKMASPPDNRKTS